MIAQRASAGSVPVLVVEDEVALGDALARFLHQSGYEAIRATTAQEALERLAECRIGIVLLDIGLPGMSGIDALSEIKRLHPLCEVVVMTGRGTIDVALDAMRKGAFEFLQKPFELDHVLLTIQRGLERVALRAENAELRGRMQARVVGLIGNSAAIRALSTMVVDLHRSDASVLIEGESGTGKEVLARAIHIGSERSMKPFVAVNCGAIPEAMLESELFGHDRGAFTGAVSATRGLMRAADGGTLFLDEIGELPLAMQVKLLRALQEQEVRPVGSTTSIRVNVRIIAATNRDLLARVESGEFRKDLYYRLAVVPMRLPALRERREDIPLLVRHFVRRLNADEQKFDEIDPAAMDRLCAWNWPGNVRELENVILRAFALGKPGKLTVSHLPAEIVGDPPAPSIVAPDGAHGGAATPPGVSTGELRAIPLSLEEFERFAFRRALAQAGGDATKAAALLKLPRSTFYRRLQRLSVRPGETPPE